MTKEEKSEKQKKEEYKKALLVRLQATFALLSSPHGEAIKKAHPKMEDELFEMSKEYMKLTSK